MNTTHTTIAPTCLHQQSALTLRTKSNCLFAALLLILSAVAHNPAAAQNAPESFSQNDDIVDRSWPPANQRGSHNSGQEKRKLDNKILQDTGTWHQHRHWGKIWRPNRNRHWRPYTIGRWKSDTSDTKDAWLWVSSEPFGKLVFHFGQWTVDPDLGWIWIPGSTWAPAWVIWRTNADYVGWAPLPPGSQRIEHAQSRAIDFDDDNLFEDDWVFVRRARLTSRDLNRNILPRDDNIYLIDITSPARDPNQFASRGDQPRYNRRGNDFPEGIYRDNPYEDDAYGDGHGRLDARTIIPWGTPFPQPGMRGRRPPAHAPDHARPRSPSPKIQATRRGKKKKAKAKRADLRKKRQRAEAKSKRLKQQAARDAKKAKPKTVKRQQGKLAARTATPATQPAAKPSSPTRAPPKHTFTSDTSQSKRLLRADAKIKKQTARPPPRKPKLKPAPTSGSATGTAAPKTQSHAAKKIRVKRTGAPVSPVVLNARPKAKSKKIQTKKGKAKKAKRGKLPKRAKKPGIKKKKPRRETETQPTQG